MSETEGFSAILVPVDFSPESIRALDFALRLRRVDGDVTVLHVIDTELAERMEKLGLTTSAEAIARMRARGREQCDWLAKEKKADFEVMIVEGLPFVEIVRIATDLDIELIALGSKGTAAPIREFLFGGTAEKVLRGARCPVLCVP
jgi:glycine betaine transporter